MCSKTSNCSTIPSKISRSTVLKNRVSFLIVWGSFSVGSTHLPHSERNRDMIPGVQAERHTQAWNFFSTNMKAWKNFVHSVKQGVQLEKYNQGKLILFLLLIHTLTGKPKQKKQQKTPHHTTKSLSPLENTQTKCLHVGKCSKSMCTVAEFWHMQDDSHSVVGSYVLPIQLN